ncbi:helix-turn-helix domain-containing protein [Actinocrinis puniceicyclus]|uniref:Helix-turn-helix domain-containing protein n=1 Tax=Actinocrinis puniceicyclus TaxID=977794 RepID=A0A8J7WUQ8_9ACTN|nr:helix-turn-helix domain-containing protein [Actinocrinis puniceicyclus]MBS2966317.1 helix-turn-helix domain-containing protein [Actinocrinis puniceicyclus]
MRIHRSAHQRFFTTLGNEVLRDNRLSFCARGILSHLLSLPNGQRGDIRTLADRTPEGRERVASALRELERFGYLRRAVKRTAEGRIYTEVDVFDAPGEPSSQAAPNTVIPGSGALAASANGDHLVKEQDEEPTLPAPPAHDADVGREGDGDVETRASAELLARVARAEPKLSMGRGEALRLAPLVTEWRRRGASDLHVIGSLTAGLPRGEVYHPVRFVETRLRSKLPAERSVAPSRLECDGCAVPVLVPGLCRTCRDVEPAGIRAGADFAQVRARGGAMARAALRGLSIDAVMPAPA